MGGGTEAARADRVSEGQSASEASRCREIEKDIPRLVESTLVKARLQALAPIDPTLAIGLPAAVTSFDVGGDGRFVMLKPGETEAPEPTRLVVVLNWSQELQQGTAAP